MAKTAIVTDSNSGITQEMGRSLGVSVIPMPFTIGDITCYEDVNLTREEFFRHMEAGDTITTSQPTPGNVMKVWDRLLETYDEIVHIPMSSGLSGSCQTAMMLADDYDDKVQVVNNQRISVTQRASVLDALHMAEKGYSAEQIKNELERVRYESSIYIMLDTLLYLKRGGRITPAAAAVGTLLRLKPVLQIQGERLDAFSKARTLAQGKQTMLSAIEKDMETRFGGRQNCHIYAVHANCPDTFAPWAHEVREKFPDMEVGEDQLSLSICTHIGPGALAVAVSRKLEIG